MPANSLAGVVTRFFLRIKARRGYNVAIVALARKILCILYHLLINQEMYEELAVNKSKSSKAAMSKTISLKGMALEEMIEVIRQNGYLVDKAERGGMLICPYFRYRMTTFSCETVADPAASCGHSLKKLDRYNPRSRKGNSKK